MIATIIAYTLHRAGFIQENLYLTYMLGVVLVSVLTKGYGAGILSSVLSVLL
ncbi:hypothetical protein H477_1434 [[Clostridium] sordellii ATCC 9714]|nr:hypothetical protein H477_1434 [[Clostridium] sordellii ATCC 9714] [Paeniclostridium sordellii ATCC 9714]